MKETGKYKDENGNLSFKQKDFMGISSIILSVAKNKAGTTELNNNVTAIAIDLAKKPLEGHIAAYKQKQEKKLMEKNKQNKSAQLSHSKSRSSSKSKSRSKSRSKSYNPIKSKNIRNRLFF